MFETIAALVLFLIPLAYSPGPGNLFFAAIGARFGTVASIPASAGYHVATWLMTFGMGLGFGGLLERYPTGFVVLKYLGGAYVIWLAWTFLRAGALDAASEARPARFMDGAFLLVLNPKAYVIVALTFTQFMAPGPGEVIHLLLLITTVFTLNNFVAFTVWTVLGDALARTFRTPSHARVVNIGFAAMLAVVGLWMAVA
jgi:threonine/homoserine/homoserine lactone efflux protein